MSIEVSGGELKLGDMLPNSLFALSY